MSTTAAIAGLSASAAGSSRRTRLPIGDGDGGGLAEAARDHGPDNRARLGAGDPGVPALDHRTGADGERRGRAIEGAVEDITAPHLAEVVRHEQVARLDHVAIAGGEDLHLEGRGGVGVEKDGGQSEVAGAHVTPVGVGGFRVTLPRRAGDIL